MKGRRILIFSTLFIFLIAGISFLLYALTPVSHPVVETPGARKIELKGFHNLYQISDSVYRSEQPGYDEMRTLEKYGIRTIINLRNYHSDNDEAKGTGLFLEWLPMNASEIEEKDILAVMKVIQRAKKPVLIHCLHGSDRTGCMIASYRIIFQNKDKEEAIQELKNPAFGYHSKWFPNIESILRAMNIDEMRKALGVEQYEDKLVYLKE